MGALIGGMYAAGKLKEVKEWLYTLTPKQILSLVDFSLKRSYIVKGDKLMDAMKQIVPDVNIEDLPIPFCAVAANLLHDREAVFRKGSLYGAMRSSISIPSFLRPMKLEEGVFIDGGVVNPLPLNRVQRNRGDLLVAVNVSAPTQPEFDHLNENPLQRILQIEYPHIVKYLPHNNKMEVDGNYFSMLAKTFALMIQQNTVLSLRLTPPDILLNIPMNRFGGFDYDRAEMIATEGKQLMEEVLAKYEA